MSSTTDGRSACLVRAIEATVAGDSSSVAELFTEDVVAWSPTASVTSRVALAVEMEDHEEAFSEIEVWTGPVVTARHRAWAEWVVTANHSGPLNVGDGLDLPPTGRRVTLRGMTVAEFVGERISAVRHYWDETELLAELGVVDRSSEQAGHPSRVKGSADLA